MFKPQSRGAAAAGSDRRRRRRRRLVGVVGRRRDADPQARRRRGAAAVVAAAPAAAPAASPPAPAAGRRRGARAGAAPPPPRPAAIFAEARQAAGAEDWEKSRAALDKLGPTIDDPALRRDASRSAAASTPNARARVAVRAVRRGVVGEELRRGDGRATSRFPPDSIYKRRAKPRYDEARTLLVAEHMAAADKARAAGRCAEVQTEVAEVVRLDAAQHDREGDGPPLSPARRAGGPPGRGRPGRGRASGEAAPEPDVRRATEAPAPRAEPAAKAAPRRPRGRAGSGRAHEAGARGLAAPAVRRRRWICRARRCTPSPA